MERMKFQHPLPISHKYALFLQIILNLKKRGLGRGLDVLLGDNKIIDQEGLRVISINKIQPGSSQPRVNIGKDSIESLSNSIKSQGLMQPILVRKSNEDKFEIIAGERRWRASKLAGLREVPVIIKNVEDSSALAMALVENLQRADLNPLEEAAGYQRLIKEYYHSHQGLADIIGKSRSHIANTIRLLNLPEKVLMAVKNGAISAGHARALLGAKKPEVLLHQVTSRELNVRQTEALVKAKNSVRQVRVEQKDSNTLGLEQDLTNLLGLRVSIKSTGEAGKITINFNSLEQLDEVLFVLRGKQPGGF